MKIFTFIRHYIRGVYNGYPRCCIYFFAINATYSDMPCSMIQGCYWVVDHPEHVCCNRCKKFKHPNTSDAFMKDFFNHFPIVGTDDDGYQHIMNEENPDAPSIRKLFIKNNGH